MIVDNIKNTECYLSLGGNLAEALRHAHALSADAACGKTELDEDRLFVTIRDIPSSPIENGVFEAHRRYLDLHYIISGTEWLDYAHLDRLTLKDDQLDANDYALYTGSGSAIKLEAGDFYIAFPQDAHKPNCHIDNACTIRKAVYKIAVK